MTSPYPPLLIFLRRLQVYSERGTYMIHSFEKQSLQVSMVSLHNQKYSSRMKIYCQDSNGMWGRVGGLLLLPSILLILSLITS